MKIKILIFTFLLCVVFAAAQPPFPPTSSSGGTSVIACVGTPGNTTGTYRQQCQTGAGALFACNNAAGCTVAADWVGATAGAIIPAVTTLIKGAGDGNGADSGLNPVNVVTSAVEDTNVGGTVLNNVLTLRWLGTLAAARMVNAGVMTGDCTTTFPTCTISAGAITAAKMVNSGVFTGDAATTFPALTIGNAAITLAKMANLAANSILGNNTGSPATPLPLTVAQVKTLLALACGDISNAAVSCSTDATNATNIGSGTLAAARLPNAGVHTGDGAGTFPAFTLTNIPTGTTMAGSVLATAIAAPSTPASGKGSIYVDSTSKNVAVKDDAGVVKHGVQTDTGAASNYISAIADNGAITKSRPACATLSDSAVSCATDATNASNLASGTVPAGRLPTLIYTPSVFGGANLIPDSSGNVFAEPFTVLSASAFFAYQIMAFADTSTLDCMYTRFNVPINYQATTTTFIIDWNTTATTGSAIWTLGYRDVSTATLAATTAQEALTVTTAVSGTASARTQSSMTATAANFSAGDIVQIRVCRDGVNEGTLAATLAIHDIRFSYVGRP